jgi:hypothetical protein
MLTICMLFMYDASRRTNREGEADRGAVDEKKRITAEEKNSIKVTYNETELMFHHFCVYVCTGKKNETLYVW